MGDRKSEWTDESVFEICVGVPTIYTATVIGKRGSSIKQISESSKCESLTFGEEFPPSHRFGDIQRCFIQGNAASIKNAIIKIGEKIDGFNQIRKERGGDPIMKCATGHLELSLVIPEMKVGMVIGKRGVRVKEIQAESKCTVDIIDEPVIGMMKFVCYSGTSADIANGIIMTTRGLPMDVFEPQERGRGGRPRASELPRGGRGRPPRSIELHRGRGDPRGRGGYAPTRGDRRGERFMPYSRDPAPAPAPYGAAPRGGGYRQDPYRSEPRVEYRGAAPRQVPPVTRDYPPENYPPSKRDYPARSPPPRAVEYAKPPRAEYAPPRTEYAPRPRTDYPPRDTRSYAPPADTRSSGYAPPADTRSSYAPPVDTRSSYTSAPTRSSYAAAPDTRSSYAPTNTRSSYAPTPSHRAHAPAPAPAPTQASYYDPPSSAQPQRRDYYPPTDYAPPPAQYSRHY